MLLMGVDDHPSFQTIAFFDEETGECGEQELNHSDGQAEKFYRNLKQQPSDLLSQSPGTESQVGMKNVAFPEQGQNQVPGESFLATYFSTRTQAKWFLQDGEQIGWRSIFPRYSGSQFRGIDFERPPFESRLTRAPATSLCATLAGCRPSSRTNLTSRGLG